MNRLSSALGLSATIVSVAAARAQPSTPPSTSSNGVGTSLGWGLALLFAASRPRRIKAERRLKADQQT